MLFRQADLLTKGLQAWVTAKQRRDFRIVQMHPDALCAQNVHAIERFECAVLVAEAGEDERLFVRIARGSGHGRSFLAPARPGVEVAEKASSQRIVLQNIRHTREQVNGLVNVSPAARSTSEAQLPEVADSVAGRQRRASR